MSWQIIGLLLSMVYIVLVIGLSKVVERWGSEASRKFIHILLGNWWLFVIYFFTDVKIASILPILFIFVNYFSYKFNLIKTMERSEGEDKDSLGTVYYAVSLFVLVVFSMGILNNTWIGLCGILTMAYGDGFAAVIGTKIKSKQYKIFGSTKSIAGSTTMFVITFIIHLVFFLSFGIEGFLWKSLLVAVVGTALEAISIKGTDNIVVPIIVSVIDSFLI